MYQLFGLLTTTPLGNSDGVDLNQYHWTLSAFKLWNHLFTRITPYKIDMYNIGTVLISFWAYPKLYLVRGLNKAKYAVNTRVETKTDFSFSRKQKFCEKRRKFRKFSAKIRNSFFKIGLYKKFSLSRKLLLFRNFSSDFSSHKLTKNLAKLLQKYENQNFRFNHSEHCILYSAIV
jgi:hypothetical protein